MKNLDIKKTNQQTAIVENWTTINHAANKFSKVKKALIEALFGL